MNNYEYIIASLPALSADYRGELDCEELVGEIRSQLSKKDTVLLDFLCNGFKSESLTGEFYREALGSRDRFIREYFELDLGLRNCKVEYLNKALSRPEGMDMINPYGEQKEYVFAGRDEAMAVFAKADLLERERALDDLMWRKIDELTIMEVFSIDLILGFVAKIQIIARWLKLDPETGRRLFEQIVEEIRNNKKELA